MLVVGVDVGSSGGPRASGEVAQRATVVGLVGVVVVVVEGETVKGVLRLQARGADGRFVSFIRKVLLLLGSFRPGFAFVFWCFVVRYGKDVDFWKKIGPVVF